MLWDARTLQCRGALPLPRHTPPPHLRSFAASQRGRYLVAAGRGRHACHLLRNHHAGRAVFLWDVPAARLVRVIDMPADARAVLQVAFVWAGPAADDTVGTCMGYWR